MRLMSASDPLPALLSPLHLLRNLHRHWPLIRQFSVRELLNRNKGSSLGILWTLLHPLLMLAVYTFVFAVVWRARWDGDATDGAANSTFATSAFCGLIVFDIFASAVGTAPALIVNNSNFVKKVIFPIEVLPLAQLGAGLCVSALSLIILVAGHFMVAGQVSRTLFCLPLIITPLLMLAAGIAWFVASLGVFLRDLKQLITGVLLPVLFFMTPIFYPPQRVPESFRWVITFNPLASIVDNARRVVLRGQWPDWTAIALSAAIGFAVMQLGYAFFMKSKRSFADVL
jgi:lipopolysaccharide transport system permease protein